MKNATTDINATAKEFSDALVSFSGSLTRNIMEVQAKNWEEMVKLGETATKIATDAVKEFPFMNAKPFTGFWGK